MGSSVLFLAILDLRVRHTMGILFHWESCPSLDVDAWVTY